MSIVWKTFQNVEKKHLFLNWYFLNNSISGFNNHTQLLNK